MSLDDKTKKDLRKLIAKFTRILDQVIDQEGKLIMIEKILKGEYPEGKLLKISLHHYAALLAQDILNLEDGLEEK